MDELDPRTPTPNDQHLDDLLWLWALAGAKPRFVLLCAR